MSKKLPPEAGSNGGILRFYVLKWPTSTIWHMNFGNGHLIFNSGRRFERLSLGKYNCNLFWGHNNRSHFKTFYRVQSPSPNPSWQARRSEVDNRKNTLSILRIGRFASTRDLGLRGGFEMASRAFGSTSRWHHTIPRW